MIKTKKAKSGKYKGEITLLKEKYPVTKKGKIDCGRVSAARAYGTLHNHIKQLEKSGLTYYSVKCGFKV